MTTGTPLHPVRSAILTTLLWTVAVGGAYPLLMGAVSILAFPAQARGSLVERGGTVVGSSLIGQAFDDQAYFQSRPSAVGYDAASSGASNLGWTSAALEKAYDDRKAAWAAANGNVPAPPDMLTASGSGLDPHISPAAAEAQVPRVARLRRLSADQQASLLALVKSREEQPQLGFLGEPRVNVLELNLAVDALFGPAPSGAK